MVNLRENLGWIIGAIVTALALIIIWLSFSTNIMVNFLFLILGNILSFLLGAGITYIIDKKTQERAWKREYAVKAAETVYMPLCTQANSVIQFLDLYPFRPVSTYLYEGKWAVIRKENRHLMIDKTFRSKLDAFFEKLRNYKDKVDEFRAEILSIISEEAERILYIKMQGTDPEFRVLYEEDNQPVGHGGIKIIDHLISQEHPREYILKNNPRRVIKEFQIQFGKEPIPVAEDKLDEFWNSCVERIKEPYQHILKEKEGMFEDATKLKDKLEERIQEPWKI
ncbi:MAG: hypothetical protein ACETVN_01425 [Asgard group archaeon]